MSRDNSVQEIRDDILAKMKGLHFTSVVQWYLTALYIGKNNLT